MSRHAAFPVAPLPIARTIITIISQTRTKSSNPSHACFLRFQIDRVRGRPIGASLLPSFPAAEAGKDTSAGPFSFSFAFSCALGAPPSSMYFAL